ncbi:MAG: hypothetical protein JXA73_10585 [Acidobacteria bacterium]|nr:hypothetical protein [Acidobacteriota bacterium]
MRVCPKCASQFGDELNFCLTCGAMLEAVKEIPPPPPAEDSSPREENRVSETIAIPGPAKGALVDAQIPLPVKDKTKAAAAPGRLCRQCPKCGSKKIIPNTRIRDQGQSSDGKLKAFIDADPEALIFKDRLYSMLLADICGECGHVELRVEQPDSLYNHYLQSRSKQRNS